MTMAKRNLVRPLTLLLILLIALPLFVVPAFAQDDGDKGDDEGQPDGDNQDDGAVEDDTEATPAPAKKDMRKEGGLVSLDFNNTDINEIIKTMSEMTGRNFMVDKSVSGQVTIISPTKVTPQEAYDIFLSVLSVNGFTTVEVGKVTKIIPRKDAKTSPISTVYGRHPRDTDEIITQLIPLENIDSNDVASAFAGMVGPDGELFAYGPSNMIIISDAASNVNRLYRIIQQLDTKGAEQKLEVITLNYADAESMAEMIEQLFEESVRKTAFSSAARRFSQGRRSRRSRARGLSRAGASASGTNIPSQTIPNIIADVRTNSLVVKSSYFGIRRVKEIVSKLDQPLPGGEGKIHVHYLQNADAEEMAMTLSELAGGGTGGIGGVSSSRSQSGLRSRTSGGRAGALSSQLGSRFGSALGGRGGLSGSMGSTGTAGRSSIASTAGRLLADFDGAARITADPPTNSLVIVASARDYKILKEVIDKLDIPRRQVFVEAVIMEVTMERGLDLGFEFRSTNDASEDGIQVIGGTNYGGISEAASNPLGVSGFALGAVDGTITFGGQEFPNIGALFRAMQTDSDINVLSTPNLLTMDNEEAEIVVADNIPFITGQIFSANNNNPTTTIERQDVGITLRLTPQINESDYVRLEIYQESSQVTDSPEGLAAAQVGVTTSKRTASTLVVVKDRQTIIIGGLMKDNISFVEAKVPVLGDIPVLGYLFKNSRKKMEKTNLLIFLTPYIIKDSSDLEEVTRLSNERMSIFREQNGSVTRSPMEDHYINNKNLTPSEDLFRAPRQGTIETDPNLREDENGQTDQTQPGQGTQEDVGQPGDEQDTGPFEDLTEEAADE